MVLQLFLSTFIVLLSLLSSYYKFDFILLISVLCVILKLSWGERPMF